MVNYNELKMQLKGLIDGDESKISILSNASALINMSLDNLNWCGFYILKDNYLYLGPFQGNPACIKIKVGNGVCGTTIKEDKTIVVKNVHEFKGHIACDSRSNSEICVPIHIGNEIYGLLDIDSPLLNRFNEEDKKGLESLVLVIEEALKNAIL